MCVKLPDPPIPSLGGGLSIPGIPPSPPFDAGLCCKIATFTVPGFASIPLVSASAAVITAAMTALKTYYRAIGPKCPRN